MYKFALLLTLVLIGASGKNLSRNGDGIVFVNFILHSNLVRLDFSIKVILSILSDILGPKKLTHKKAE